jgi:hypothetical protein
MSIERHAFDASIFLLSRILAAPLTEATNSLSGAAHLR